MQSDFGVMQHGSWHQKQGGTADWCWISNQLVDIQDSKMIQRIESVYIKSSYLDSKTWLFWQALEGTEEHLSDVADMTHIIR